MKVKQLVIVLIFIALAACSPKSDQESGEKRTASADSVYGAKIDDKGAITMPELLKQMEGKSMLENVKVTATITEVCQEMGCWMHVDRGDSSTMFVKMKDHEFFVPKDAAGRTAIFSGTAKLDTISVEELRHYAEDAKKPQEEIDKITQPKFEVNFIAAGVIIK